MKLTDEQRQAVLSTGNLFLDSCPGSGKTRTIVAKLLRCLESVRESPRRIACITYTNAAVYEILDRLRTYGDSRMEQSAEVATIHAFCLNSILYFNAWRIPALKDGFDIVAPDEEFYLKAIKTLRQKYGFSSREDEKFQLVVRGIDGAALLPPGTAITQAAFQEFWKILEDANRIDFASLLYYSYCVLRDFPQVASAISGEFEWILIDEFQDTTQVQLEIFRLLHARGHSRFFLVGDPNQSIYGFAGARPDLIYRFAEIIGAETGVQLGKNWRSTDAIIRDAESMRARTPAMECVPDATRPEIRTEYISAPSLGSGVVDYFIPAVAHNDIQLGNAAILAQNWFQLFDLAKHLRNAGISCVGPGSRPYKRIHLVARFIEDICGYIGKHDDRIVSQLERELFRITLDLTGKPAFRAYDFSGRLLIYELINTATALASRESGAIKWIEQFAPELGRALVLHGFLPGAAAKAIEESAAQIVAEIRERVPIPASYSIQDLGYFANPDDSIRLLTIHAAKGREFDAVAIGGLHEGALPYGGKNATPTEVEEAARRFYVGITRARRMLYYITDRSKSYNVPTRFLGAEWLQKL